MRSSYLYHGNACGSKTKSDIPQFAQKEAKCFPNLQSIFPHRRGNTTGVHWFCYVVQRVLSGTLKKAITNKGISEERRKQYDV